MTVKQSGIAAIMAKAWLSNQETAQHFGISERTLTNWWNKRDERLLDRHEEGRNVAYLIEVTESESEKTAANAEVVGEVPSDRLRQLAEEIAEARVAVIESELRQLDGVVAALKTENAAVRGERDDMSAKFDEARKRIDTLTDEHNRRQEEWNHLLHEAFGQRNSAVERVQVLEEQEIPQLMAAKEETDTLRESLEAERNELRQYIAASESQPLRNALKLGWRKIWNR